MSAWCPEPQKSRSLHNAEEYLMRKMLNKYTSTLLPMIVFFLGLSFYPAEDTKHLHVPSLLISSLVGFCYIALQVAATTTDGDQLRSRVLMTENLCLVTRILIHIVCIIYDGDSSHVFLKIVSLWWLPFGFPKACDNLGSFQAYLLIHNLLTIVRFRSELVVAGPWLVSTVVMDKMLLDLAYQEHVQFSTRLQLKTALSDLEKIAEVTTQRMFERFCDATASLDKTLSIVEPAPLLAAMLGLSENQMRGRLFTSLVEAEDSQRFLEHMESVSHESPKELSEKMRPDYIQLTLMDAYASAVPVHIFHASFTGLKGEVVHYMGVSETWRPPKSKKRRGISGPGTTPSAQISGSLLDDSSSGGPGDDGGGFSPELSPSCSGVAGKATPTSRRRVYSPRPTKGAATKSPIID